MTPPGKARWGHIFVGFTATLIFYLYTLSPSLSWGDGVRLQREALTGESFILAELVDRPMAPDPYPFAKLGGAAWDHPLYVVLGYALSDAGPRLFPGSDPLWWVNLISALFGAGTVALVFALGRRLSGSAWAGAVGAGMLAVSHTFWWHAATPEVYTLHAFLLLAALSGFIAFYQSGKRGPLVAAAVCFGLAVANHFLAVLALAALLGFVIFNLRSLSEKGAFQPRSLAVLAVCFLLASAILPIQALRLLRSFAPAELLGVMLGTTFFDNLPAMPVWESLLRYLGLLLVQFSPVGVVLGVVGLWRAGRDRSSPAFLLPLAYLVYTAFSVLYRVPDQFAFHLTSYVFFALGIAMAPRLRSARRLSAGLSVIVPLQILAAPFFYAWLPGALPAAGIDEAAFGVPQVGTGVRDGLEFYVNPNKRGDFGPAEFGRATLAALPPDALVLAQWYADTDEYFILRYFQAVEGLRPDVEVEGWVDVDPFAFGPNMALERVEAELGRRPLYVASEGVYGIEGRYCLVEEHALYRVLPCGD